MRNYFRKHTFLMLLVLVLANFSFAQDSNFPAPREETLLNGLKVLIWNQPNTGRVEIKLRVHSGASFDPQDKEGAMAMLTEILFPEEGIEDYFKEDLEGNLEIINTHDYFQINTTAKASEFLTVIETLSSAVSEPQIDKETFAKVKPRYLEKIVKLEKDPNYIADRAIAERLFGDYPYGRAVHGTTESVNKLDFADLIFARQRFLKADNATLTIRGDVKPNYAYRAARRLFGGWQKSLNTVPANFRIPAKPETSPLTINVDDSDIYLERYALESVSRKDKDYFASKVLMEILDNRFKKSSEQKGLKSAYVKNNPSYLRGYMVFAKDFVPSQIPVMSLAPNMLETESNETVEKEKPVEEENSANSFIPELIREKITKEEFDSAKNKVLSDLNKMEATEFWFDVYTYKLDSIKSELKNANNVSLADVQRIANVISKNTVVEANIESAPDAKQFVETEKVKIPNQLEKEEDPKDPIK